MWSTVFELGVLSYEDKNEVYVEIHNLISNKLICIQACTCTYCSVYSSHKVIITCS